MLTDDLSLSDGSMLSAPTAFDAVQDETRSLQYLDWLGGKLFPAIGRGLAIVAVVMAGLVGPLATLAAGGAMLAFEVGRAYFRNQADLKRELTLYHDDIARVLNKSPNEKLTIADMRNAADEKYVGDKALKPLKMELDHLDQRSRYNYLIGIGRSIATTIGALLMGSTMSHVGHMIQNGEWSRVGGSLFMPITGSLAGIGTLTFAIEKLGKNHFDNHRLPSIYKELAQLQETVKHRPLEPEQVFPITVMLNKQLAEDIKTNYGKPYDQLPHLVKREVVKAYEPIIHTQALTKKINKGKMSVSAIALNAFHQLDWPESTAMSYLEKKNSPEMGMTTKKKMFVATYLDEKSLQIMAERDR